MIPADAVTDLGRVHVIGIGGAGMSGIARILVAAGVPVSGSDAKDSRRLDALRALGVQVHVGHDAAVVGEVDTVIYSTAIPERNPERHAAAAAGIRMLTRADALSLVMQGSRGVAVAGTHGKTTTTSMLTVALQRCGADPSFAIGSELAEAGSNAHLGSGEIFVAEADESDGAFLALHPVASLITNIEPDHLNHWGTFDAIREAFDSFADMTTDAGGYVVACADDHATAELIARMKREHRDVRSYGVDASADYRIVDAQPGTRGWHFAVEGSSGVLARMELLVPGLHNVRNATAALVTGIGLGFAPERLAAGLGEFTGARRRFDLKGEVHGIRVIDDYAHHPTEIEATLRAAREVVGGGRLVVAFQAHHYYRTAMFIEEFGTALGLADDVVVLEVYAPGETPIPGASGQTMAANVPLPKEHVIFEPRWSAVAGHLASRARPGDMVLTLGAGDIGMVGLEVLELLERQG